MIEYGSLAIQICRWCLSFFKFQSPRRKETTLSRSDFVLNILLIDAKGKSGSRSGSRSGSGQSTPRTPTFSNYGTISGGELNSQYTFPLPQLSETETYYQLLESQILKRNLSSLCHVSFRNPLITFYRHSHEANQTISFSQVVTTQDMRNLYLMFALCPEHEILQHLLSQKIADYSHFPSP